MQLSPIQWVSYKIIQWKSSFNFLDHAHLDNLWHVNFLLCQIWTLSVERSDKDKCVFAHLWVQDLTEELVNDGHEGNAWVFTLPLCLSCPFPRLFSPFPSHLLPPLCGFFSWHFLSSALNSALLSPQMGTVQIKSNKGLLSTIMCWNTVAALKLRRRDTLLSLWIPRKMQDFHECIFQWQVSVGLHSVLQGPTTLPRKMSRGE